MAGTDCVAASVSNSGDQPEPGGNPDRPGSERRFATMPQLAFALIVSVAIGLGVMPPAARSAPAWPPRDDAAKVPALRETRDALRTALRSGDWDTVRKYTHPDISLGAQGGRGRPQFLARLRARKALGPSLATLLGRGGALTARDRFAAPYTALVDPAGIPRDRAGVLLARNVPLLDAPKDGAAVVAKRSYAVVSVPEWAIGYEGEASPEGWLRVESGGVAGYVRTGQIAPVVSFVLHFRRVNGVWWLIRLDTSFE